MAASHIPAKVTAVSKQSKLQDDWHPLGTLLTIQELAERLTVRWAASALGGCAAMAHRQSASELRSDGILARSMNGSTSAVNHAGRPGD